MAANQMAVPFQPFQAKIEYISCCMGVGEWSVTSVTWGELEHRSQDTLSLLNPVKEYLGLKPLYFLCEVKREGGKESLRQMCDEEEEKIILYVTIVNLL